MNKEYIDILKTKISYVKEGAGNPVVILHGWGASIETIAPIINILKDDFQVYAYDAPGFGDSDDPEEVLSTYDYCEYLRAFLEKMNLDRAVFIGHSFGGKTLSIFAAKYPEKVEKLILIDASGVKPRRKLHYYLKVYSFKFLKFLYLKLNFSKNKDERLESFYRKFGSDDYKQAQGIMRKTFVKVVNENTDVHFKDIKTPTLLVWGEKDEDTPLYMAEVFEKNIEDSGLVILKNAGHYSYLDDYYTFQAVLKSFLG
ncbi:alpha/beta hydrolase fold protein [Peptoniphilus sp. ING2-D1G]|nr:alpha/beta hydrolase fold protein [Peptoniphilus sp. ING2-D1G]